MKILIDPGHGGGDPGAEYKTGSEDALNLNIASKLGSILLLKKHEVKLTRISDLAVSITARLAMEAKELPDIVVSVHCNASENPAASGTEVVYWYKSGKGKFLAECVNSRLLGLPIKNRPLYQSDDNPATWWRDLAMVHRTKAPSILVECGFGSNPDDLAYLNTASGQMAVALAIAAGIENYFNPRKDD